MRTHRTVNLRIRATPAKFERLFVMASACRFVWNWATRINRSEYGGWLHDDAQSWLYQGGPHAKLSVSFFTWGKRFTKLRRSTPWLAEVPCAPLRATLRRWSQSWSNYFSRTHPQRGKPTFHSRDHKLWVDFPDDSAKLCGDWLRLSGVGWVRLRGSNRYAGAKVKSVHVASEDGVKWFASIGYEVELPDMVDDDTAIGVDMNCGQIALSTGHIIDAPDVSRLEARRKRHQRRMDRCAKGSNRRKKMRHAGCCWTTSSSKTNRSTMVIRPLWRNSRRARLKSEMLQVQILPAAPCPRGGIRETRPV